MTDLLQILAVAITTLLMIVLGGWITQRFQAGKRTWRRVFFGFLLFIFGIFLLGFLNQQLQAAVYDYLQQNVANSVAGLIVTVAIAFFLYMLLVWRKYNKD